MSQENIKHDIFISYRREGGFETARYLYDHLKWDGYFVTFDLDTLRNGRFDEALLKRIDECTDFIIVLNSGCFDRTLDPGVSRENDWLRSELGYALRHGKNVIPVRLRKFEFPAKLPDDIDGVRRLNGPAYSREYIDEFYHKLKTFLKTTCPKAEGTAEDPIPAGKRGGMAADSSVLRKSGRGGRGPNRTAPRPHPFPLPKRLPVILTNGSRGGISGSFQASNSATTMARSV